MKERPKKTIFPESKQKQLREKVQKYVLKMLLPDSAINKIILFGSLVKGNFGRYEKSFKGRDLSDIDVLLFVEESFEIPKNWKQQYTLDLYDIYDAGDFENILVQIMVCKKSSYTNKEHQQRAEPWGVPLLLK